MQTGWTPTVRRIAAGIATDLGALRVEHRALVRERRRVALAVPDVGVAGDDPQRPPLAAAADQERHPRLDGRRIVA